MHQGDWRYTLRGGPARSVRATSRLARAVRSVVAIERLEARRFLAGTISGTVFCDRNFNNALDGTEPQILNATNSRPVSVTVFLDLNNSSSLDGGDTSMLVDANGNYSFGGLADGNYSVGEITPASYTRTGPLFLPVTITGGNAVSGKNIGNFPIVFDANSNGNGSDQYTVRRAAGDATRVEIVQQLLGQSPVTYSGVMASLSTLTINSGGGDDMLTVDYTNGSPIPSVGLNVDGGSQSTANADRMTVTGSAGPDTIVLNNLDTSPGGGSIAFKNLEKCTVNGGSGSDTLTLGSFLATETTFDGGANTDSMIYNATGNADTLTLLAGAITTGVNTGQYLNTESVFINCMGGNDTITLSSSGSGTPVTLNGGDGNDTLNIDTTPSSPLLFNGGLLINDHDVVAVRVGTFNFDADAANGTANLAVSVSADGTAIFNSTQHLESLTIDNGGNAGVSSNGNRVLVTRALTIGATGKLDLTNNDLVLNYSMVSPAGTWNGSAYSGITGMIQTGYNGGSWTGNGIRTSSATSITQLGVAEASQVFGISGGQTGLFSGETVDASSVLVKYTYTGDATLDGKLNVDDYGRIDFNAPFSGSVFGYYNGDFTFDGKINIDDYGKLDFALTLQGLPL